MNHEHYRNLAEPMVIDLSTVTPAIMRCGSSIVKRKERTGGDQVRENSKKAQDLHDASAYHSMSCTGSTARKDATTCTRSSHTSPPQASELSPNARPPPTGNRYKLHPKRQHCYSSGGKFVSLENAKEIMGKIMCMISETILPGNLC